MNSYENEEIDIAFDCLDCPANTIVIREYYMVNFDVWAEAHPKNVGMLCIACLGKRLGRELNSSDFLDAPVNEIDGLFWEHSELLHLRLITPAPKNNVVSLPW